MATESKTAGADPEVLSDIEALMRHLADKTPVDAELSRRVTERANRLTEELRGKAPIDIEKLIHDARDES
jgi:hypothetical protein